MGRGKETASPCWSCAHYGGQVGTWSDPEVLCLHGTGRRREKRPNHGCVYWFYPDRPEARVIVSGSSELRDMEIVARALDKLLLKKHLVGLIHGVRPGAEVMADEWAQHRNVPITRCTSGPGVQGLDDTAVRNAKMIRLQPTGVVILSGHQREVGDLITQARVAGLPIWYPYGGQP